MRRPEKGVQFASRCLTVHRGILACTAAALAVASCATVDGEARRPRGEVAFTVEIVNRSGAPVDVYLAGRGTKLATVTSVRSCLKVYESDLPLGFGAQSLRVIPTAENGFETPYLDLTMSDWTLEISPWPTHRQWDRNSLQQAPRCGGDRADE